MKTRFLIIFRPTVATAIIKHILETFWKGLLGLQVCDSQSYTDKSIWLSKVNFGVSFDR